MEAFQLRLVDEEFYAHRQAFLNYQVQATDKKGKPIYRRFDKFYDYEKAIGRLAGENTTDSRFSALKEHLRKDKQDG